MTITDECFIIIKMIRGEDKTIIIHPNVAIHLHTIHFCETHLKIKNIKKSKN